MALRSRRAFLLTATSGIGVALLAACSAPSPSAGPTSAPASASGGSRKQVTFWGRQQFLPESNDYLTESVKLAGQKGGFDVSVQLFTNDEHPQKEVVAMESGVVPDITYTYAPALWDQNGYALEIQSLYDDIGKSGGGWLDLADGSSKTTAGKRIAVPMNTEPWFVHFRKDKFAEVGVSMPIKTWDEMMSAFQKVNKPDEGFYAFDGQMTEADWVGNCLQFMWAFGGRLFDKEGTPTINTPQNIAGVKAYTDLFKNKMMPVSVAGRSGEVYAGHRPDQTDLRRRLLVGHDHGWRRHDECALADPVLRGPALYRGGPLGRRHQGLNLRANRTRRAA